jgi:hypothetical protein
MDLGGQHFTINELAGPQDKAALVARENARGQLLLPAWVYKDGKEGVQLLVWYCPTEADKTDKSFTGTLQQTRAFFEQGELRFSSLSMAHRCLVDKHNNCSNWTVRVRRGQSYEEKSFTSYNPRKGGAGFVNEEMPFPLLTYTKLDTRLSIVYPLRHQARAAAVAAQPLAEMSVAELLPTLPPPEQSLPVES